MAFKRSMTADELFEWLRSKGLHQDDCHLLREKKFTGGSFLVLEEEHFSELGVKYAGKVLLPKLIEEAKRDLEGSIADQIQNGDARKENGSSENPIGDIQQEKPAVGDDDVDNGLDEKQPHAVKVEYLKISVEVDDSSDEEGYLSDSENQPVHAAGYASFKPEKIWPKDHSILNVDFLNPDILKTWQSHERDEMNTDKIMDWAKEWNKGQLENVPKFVEADNRYTPDIRVEFTESRNCWSKIGRRAQSILKRSEPTMCLKLNGLSSKEQKHMVIQAFGHALGLKHEHWRSDFWSIVGEHIDKGKMKKDGVDLSRKSKINYPYDQDSIMHHWFDWDWFKNRTYQNRSKILEDCGSKLNKKENSYLIWIHDREYTNAPSKTDFKVLEEAYKGNS